MAWKGFKDRFITITIDLQHSEEELLYRADRSRRKNIAKAEREGLIFIEAKPEEWTEWYNIYSSVWIDSGIPPASLESLRKNSYKLFLAKREEKILGGGLFEEQSEEIRFEAYVSLREYREIRVNDFLYWKSILYAKSHGKKYVDLGGWQENARDNLGGVNEFKQKWGGEKKIVEVYSYNPFYIIGRKLIRKFNFFWSLNKKIKIILWKRKNSLFKT